MNNFQERKRNYFTLFWGGRGRNGCPREKNENDRTWKLDVELEVFSKVFAERRFSRNFLDGGRGDARRGEAREGGARRDAEKEPGKFNSRSLYLIIFYIGF